jgi:hypothetical protein
MKNIHENIDFDWQRLLSASPTARDFTYACCEDIIPDHQQFQPMPGTTGSYRAIPLAFPSQKATQKKNKSLAMKTKRESHQNLPSSNILWAQLP